MPFGNVNVDLVANGAGMGDVAAYLSQNGQMDP